MREGLAAHVGRILAYRRGFLGFGDRSESGAPGGALHWLHPAVPRESRLIGMAQFRDTMAP